MTELLALSVEAAISPSFRLQAIRQEDSGLDQPFGWGVAWYPSGGTAAMVVKDPTSVGKNALTNVLSDWERFASPVFVAHLRGAAKRTQIQDTHPFTRSYAGRDWVLAHNGDLRHGFREALPLGDAPAFEPMGRTDSEHLLCWLLEQLRGGGRRAIGEVEPVQWAAWLRAVNELGTLNLIFTDGVDVIAYSDAFGYRPLWFTRRGPPNPVITYTGPEVEIELGSVADVNKTAVVVSSSELSDDGWTQLEPGHLLVARRGAIRWTGTHGGASSKPVAAVASAGATAATAGGRSAANASGSAVGGSAASAGATPGPGQRTPVGLQDAARPTGAAPASGTRPRRGGRVAADAATPGGGTEAALDRAALALRAPEVAQAGMAREQNDDFGSSVDPPRVLETVHETRYTYEEAVVHSHHLLRMRPVVDELQELVEFELTVRPDGARTRRYTDVFGNSALEMRIRDPYVEWYVRARSVVRLKCSAHPRLRSLYERQRLPLVWMPWQRQMMMPYLLPPELPETQLRELSEYALSFAERQDNDLVETLKDMNRTIFTDYTYDPKATNLGTTPFEVFMQRRGVCQDFSNLFIALCRLLDVPARYRVGYIFTGGKYDNERQGDASHAWVEVYIPLVGWRGFDPTNGCIVGPDHVRVACGRNFRDATPSSGTLYAGGKGERLSVRVQLVDKTAAYAG